MKRVVLSIIVILWCISSIAQVPQGFNYQAVAHTSTGAPIANTTIQVKAAILSDTLTPVVVWEELHSTVKTNANGVFSLIIGTGTRQSGSALTFNEVAWTKSLFIKMQLYYQNSWKNMGSAKLWAVPYAMVADELSGSVKKLTVTGGTSDMEEALFEVKNKEGQTVFAVYNEGVRIYVDDGAKGVKGGFAIGGFGTNKGPGEEYLRVTRDSTRIYLNDTISKAVKGGFAIGGFGTTKKPGSEYMMVEPGNTKFYVRTLADESSSTFNIVGLDQNQSEMPLLMANKDTIEVSGVLNLQNNLIVNGNVNVSGIVTQDSSKIAEDADGNIYETVIIGDQVWTKENLKTTKYNDGTSIPLVTVNSIWNSLSTPAYCWQNNDESVYKNLYGALYNWYAVNTGKLCPTGWHVPTDNEWKTLEMYLGMTQEQADGSGTYRGTDQGTQIKNTTGWSIGGTNNSGFSALPGGCRDDINGAFYYTTSKAYGWFWSPINDTATDVCYRGLTSSIGGISRLFVTKRYGFSVRCVKD
jgi:uncharacterized protein (TIGR02145 family)